MMMTAGLAEEKRKIARHDQSARRQTEKLGEEEAYDQADADGDGEDFWTHRGFI